VCSSSCARPGQGRSFAADEVNPGDRPVGSRATAKIRRDGPPREPRRRGGAGTVSPDTRVPRWGAARGPRAAQRHT
jgi:hypothetical protein